MCSFNAACCTYANISFVLGVSRWRSRSRRNGKWRSIEQFDGHGEIVLTSLFKLVCENCRKKSVLTSMRMSWKHHVFWLYGRYCLVVHRLGMKVYFSLPFLPILIMVSLVDITLSFIFTFVRRKTKQICRFVLIQTKSMRILGWHTNRLE